VISHEHKFILITPQKTGSTSLLKRLIKYCDIKRINKQGKELFDIIDEFEDLKGAPGLKKWGSKHIRIQQIKRGLDESNIDINSYIKIGVVRNPFDRLVSFWSWKARGNRGISLSKFSREMPPCFPFFTLDGRMGMDHIIRFENLQEDFNDVCDKIGIPREELPHINKSKHKHYTEYYDEETQQIVADKYKKDIEYFGYKFRE